MHVNLDPQLVDKIANEVKSQGVFDQFRKDSMADVDTKPAYQNLRQRVENTVNKFLSEQKWTPDLNKNQLREKLRKHITEAGFLDVGVERIVDQVVNPKIATVFQPKIEDIAYKYLGIPKPQPKEEPTNGPSLNGLLQIETDLMPTDLEQVSPDSDKCTVKSDSKDDMETDMEIDKIDDFESPPFEPIETGDIGQSKSDNNLSHEEIKIEIKDPIQLMSIEADPQIKEENYIKDVEMKIKDEPPTLLKQIDEGEANISAEASQESQLSQVSSDSRLSIVTNENTQDEQSIACNIKEENHANISEEAQMPKFNENSNSGSERKPSESLHFDIKKDEIKFEGTERKTHPETEAMSPLNTTDEPRLDGSSDSKNIDNSDVSDIPLPSNDYSFDKENDFKFSKIEVKVDLEEITKTTSLDDSADRELHIIEKSEMSQCSVSQQSVKSPTVKQEKIFNSPSVTSSPIQTHKSSHREREHSSSSRHKKYSKDRRSDKDRDKHSSSSSHKVPSLSTSSKYHSSKSSSSHRPSGTSSEHYHHHHRSSSSSTHKSKHSSRNGKSSKSHHDSKESRSRDHSKSRSDKTKEKSSKEKSERSKLSDDHYSSKQQKWRKSTDSNDDEDSCHEGTRTCGPKDNGNSVDTTSNGTHNNSSTLSGASNANNSTGPAGTNVDNSTSANAIGQKIVILDNLLDDPKTNFIEIGNAHVQVNSNEHKTCPYDGEFLYYYENNINAKHDIDFRLNLITKSMENLRKILHTYSGFPQKLSTTDTDSNISDELDKSERRESISSTSCELKRGFESPSISPTLTSATLTIDCIQYGNVSNTHCPNKRFKFNGTPITKVSPTPSELSINSKENEFVDKNAQSDIDQGNAKNVMDKVKRKTIINNSQRYTSEDLYKPRPILSQRSRRRGLDAVI